MEIKSVVTNSTSDTVSVVYRDIDSASELEERKVSAVHAYCFYDDKLLIVYSEKKGAWTPPGGRIEENESVEEAVVREVREEANMKVLKHLLIGFQDILLPTGTITQTRSVCIVEPYGEFVSDPDEDVTEIRLINPEDYKKYFDWGEVGDHVLKRALEFKGTLWQ